MSELQNKRQHTHLRLRQQEKRPETALQEATEKKIRFDYMRKYDLLTLIGLFFIFSFIGWCWEVSLHIVKDHAFVNRGVLHGPYLPIYGSGGVLIVLFLRRLAKNPVVLFFGTVVLCGIVEYFTSWYLETTKGIKWWDYSGRILNLNGRICAEGLIIFGLGGCAILYVGAPFFAELLDKIDQRVKFVLLMLLLALFIADAVYSHFHPNTGKGITDYGEDATTGMAVLQRALPAEAGSGTKAGFCT